MEAAAEAAAKAKRKRNVERKKRKRLQPRLLLLLPPQSFEPRRKTRGPCRVVASEALKPARTRWLLR